jgi:hypothetical protein
MTTPSTPPTPPPTPTAPAEPEPRRPVMVTYTGAQLLVQRQVILEMLAAVRSLPSEEELLEELGHIEFLLGGATSPPDAGTK